MIKRENINYFITENTAVDQAFFDNNLGPYGIINNGTSNLFVSFISDVYITDKNTTMASTDITKSGIDKFFYILPYNDNILTPATETEPATYYPNSNIVIEGNGHTITIDSNQYRGFIVNEGHYISVYGFDMFYTGNKAYLYNFGIMSNFGTEVTIKDSSFKGTVDYYDPDFNPESASIVINQPNAHIRQITNIYVTGKLCRGECSICRNNNGSIYEISNITIELMEDSYYGPCIYNYGSIEYIKNIKRIDGKLKVPSDIPAGNYVYLFIYSETDVKNIDGFNYDITAEYSYGHDMFLGTINHNLSEVFISNYINNSKLPFNFSNNSPKLNLNSCFNPNLFIVSCKVTLQNCYTNLVSTLATVMANSNISFKNCYNSNYDNSSICLIETLNPYEYNVDYELNATINLLQCYTTGINSAFGLVHSKSQIDGSNSTIYVSNCYNLNGSLYTGTVINGNVKQKSEYYYQVKMNEGNLWSDSTANSILIVEKIWYSISQNTPYLLTSFGTDLYPSESQVSSSSEESISPIS